MHLVEHESPSTDNGTFTTQELARLAAYRAAVVAGCMAESLPVLLVEAEQEGMLCPRHQLVLLDGSAVEGEPMLATAVW